MRGRSRSGISRPRFTAARISRPRRSAWSPPIPGMVLSAARSVGRLLGHRQHRLVVQDPEGGPVGPLGHLLPPLVQLPQDRELSALERLGALEPEIARLPVRRAVQRTSSSSANSSSAQPSRPRASSCALRMSRSSGRWRVSEAAYSSISRRERPRRPVGALEALVEPHAEVLLEQRGQPDAGLVQQLRRDPGVEHARWPGSRTRGRAAAGRSRRRETRSRRPDRPAPRRAAPGSRPPAGPPPPSRRAS